MFPTERGRPIGRESSRVGGLSQCAPIFFLRHQKENPPEGLLLPLRGNSPSAPRPVEKKKCSAGRSACMRTSCRRRGMVGCPSRQSGTETPSPWGSLQPGEVQGYPLPLSPLPLTLPRRTRQRLAKRKARKEKLFKCDLAPRRPPHHPPRDGSIDLTEDSSVPEGQTKSEQAPVRRPPCARRAAAPERGKKRPFLLDRARPVFFSARSKRKWGVHCPAGIPAESPGRQIAAPTAPPAGGAKKGGRPSRPAAPRSVFTPKIP